MNDSLWNRPASATQAAVLGCLERGGAVVTANARAARALQRWHGAEQRSAGLMAWPTPPIQDWGSWLGILWKQHRQSVADAPLLLTPFQERAVWKRLTRTQDGESESIALLASEAWRLLSEFAAHGERLRSWTGWATPDAEAFREWANAFERECIKRQWASHSDLPSLLTESIARGTIELPPEVLLIGFDRITPVRQALVAASRAAGVQTITLESTTPLAKPRLVLAEDLKDELTTCAWWARRTLDSDPSARIAVVVHDIDSLRGEMERTFRHVVTPEYAGIESPATTAFEFSLGTPLAAAPLVKAALLLVRWLAAPLEQTAISWLILSGFLAADGDQAGEMAAFDAEIRHYGRMPPEASLAAFAAYRPRAASAATRRLLARLREFERVARADIGGGRTKTFLEWTDMVDRLLRQVGWPGSLPLQTTEFQALSRWERLVGDIARLSFDRSQVAYPGFVAVLDRYAIETVFAPESQEAPIQIMGAPESSGQEFDAVWILGADDQQWPAPVPPHPLLPRPLQRKAAMAHSSFDVDWASSMATLRRIASSAPRLVVSYSQRDSAGELRPSALLNKAFDPPLSPLSCRNFRLELQVPERPPHRCLTVPVQEDSSIPWPTELIAGGADILKDQSACAFRGFAVPRLGAEDLYIPERGLSPRDRGDILHKVLDALWSKDNLDHARLQTLADLVAAKREGRLEMILRGHIRSVFDQRAGGRQKSGWGEEYLRIEQRRLYLLLSLWLDYETTRTDFMVTDLEKQIEADIDGLRLRLRVDRIDRVAGGSMIIDYKTGKVSAALWAGSRPDDPQLPIYGIHGSVEDLRGILFAQIRARETAFVGRVEDATATVSNLLRPQSDLLQKPLHPAELHEWADAIGRLARDFLAGEAAVAPKSFPKTCRHCALPALCRVTETLVVLDREEEDDMNSEGDTDSWIARRTVDE